MNPQANRNPETPGKAVANPLASLHDYGQAVWLDFLARRFIADGGLLLGPVPQQERAAATVA